MLVADRVSAHSLTRGDNRLSECGAQVKPGRPIDLQQRGTNLQKCNINGLNLLIQVKAFYNELYFSVDISRLTD